MTLVCLTYCAVPGSIREQCMWVLWRKCIAGRNFYRVLRFNLSITIPLVINIQSPMMGMDNGSIRDGISTEKWSHPATGTKRKNSYKSFYCPRVLDVYWKMLNIQKRIKQHRRVSYSSTK